MDHCGLKEILYKIHNSANKLLHSALVLFTDLTAGILGHVLFRRHFHCLLSGLVLFGPVLSLWVSKYSIFGNKNHYLYRQDLIRHLSRLAVTGTLWTLFRRLLSFLLDASGTCFEPLQSTTEVCRNPGELLDSDTGPLLLLREEKGNSRFWALHGSRKASWSATEDSLHAVCVVDESLDLPDSLLASALPTVPFPADRGSSWLSGMEGTL
ncbi:unnamed protein product [Leuciscus chuanchicus]